MEANTFIKSVTVEGNKIKDIKFYGDWEISTAGGSSSGGTIEFSDPLLVKDEFDGFITLYKSGNRIYATVTSPVETQISYGYSTKDDLFINSKTSGLAIKLEAGKTVTFTLESSSTIKNNYAIFLCDFNGKYKTYRFTKAWLTEHL
jgi:hypothetical protein